MDENNAKECNMEPNVSNKWINKEIKYILVKITNLIE